MEMSKLSITISIMMVATTKRIQATMGDTVSLKVEVSACAIPIRNV